MHVVVDVESCISRIHLRHLVCRLWSGVLWLLPQIRAQWYLGRSAQCAGGGAGDHDQDWQTVSPSQTAIVRILVKAFYYIRSAVRSLFP